MDLSAYKAISIGGIAMKKLTLDGVQIWSKGITNWVRKSINADGTIYNGGLGYKDGYRIRSGGAETTAASGTCTGYIKVNGGDVIRISGCNFGLSAAENAINASDSSFTNIGQVVRNNDGYGIFASSAAYHDYSRQSIVEEKTGVWKWVVPPAASNVAYIRITGRAVTYGAPQGVDLIVTINEEI